MSCLFAPANFFTLTSTDCSRGALYNTVMDMNEYVLEMLVRDRLAEIRAEVEQSNRIRAAAPNARPWKLAWRHALIRMVHRLQTIEAPSTHGATRG